MLIYIFAEHYPSPYKPQFDTEFAFFLRQGHDIRIFAGSAYLSTIHGRVKKFGLDRRTQLIPTTLKSLPRFIAPILKRLIGSPLHSLRQIRAIYDGGQSPKENLLRIARMLVLPKEDPDLCYVHNIVTAAGVDFLRRRYPKSRMAMYFHGGEVGGVSRTRQEARLFRDMDVVFANTEFARQQTIDRGCPAERAFVQQVTFDLEDYPVSGPKRYREGGKLRLISVGRFSEEKGLTYAFDAVASLVRSGARDIHYTIVGSGRQREFLKKYVHDAGLDEYVTWAGEQDKQGVVRHLDKSDVLILPSLITDTWAETQACVVQEAMFMRNIVVTTRAGGVPESIAEGMRPFVVPPADAAAIEERIRKILALSEAEALRLGEDARAFTVGKYDVERITGRLLDLAFGRRHATTESPAPLIGKAGLSDAGGAA